LFARSPWRNKKKQLAMQNLLHHDNALTHQPKQLNI